MKKGIAFILLLGLMLGLGGYTVKSAHIDLPFEVGDVENIEMYHYECTPVSAEKKVVTAEDDINAVYEMFEDVSVKNKKVEDIVGADVTSFRFHLSDGTDYELIYVCDGEKRGSLKSRTGNFSYFTRADIGAYWNHLNTELKAAPVKESELPYM